MKSLWDAFRAALMVVGGWMGYFMGGLDGMLIALIVFIAIDYLTGVMCAIEDKTLSSAVGFRGIAKKVLILLLVGMANVLDVHVIGSGSAMRGAVICFYLANEGVSILENAARLGLPVPDGMKKTLAQLNGKDGGKEGENDDE